MEDGFANFLNGGDYDSRGGIFIFGVSFHFFASRASAFPNFLNCWNSTGNLRQYSFYGGFSYLRDFLLLI